MNDQMIKIDVESIMEEIKQKIKEKGYQENTLSFDDLRSRAYTDESSEFSIMEFENYLANLNTTWNIKVNHKIESANLFGKLSNSVKKVIRKFIQFYIIPIVEEQRDFNEASKNSINQVAKFINSQNDLRNIIDELKFEFNKNIKKEIKITQKNFEELKLENENLKKNIMQLQEKYENQEKLLQLLTQRLEVNMLKFEKLQLQQNSKES